MDGVLDHSIMGACSSNAVPTISLPENQIETVRPRPTPSLILNQEEIKTLETNIRLKEAEANLFQRLADEARKELETYHMIHQATTKEKKMEEEYTSSFALLDGDVRKRKKSEEPYKNMGGQHRRIAKMRKRVDATMEMLGPQCGAMEKGA